MATTATKRIGVFLFTDLVDSVRLNETIGAERFARAIRRHNELFKSCIERSASGRIVDNAGDGYFAEFDSVSDAVNTALRFQHLMRTQSWDHEKLSVRAGVHLGEIVELGEDDGAGDVTTVGMAKNIAARVMGLGAGDQILLTRAAFDSARETVQEHPDVSGCDELPTLDWKAHGRYVFQGSDDAREIFEVGAAGVACLTAPKGGGKAKRAVSDADEDTLGWRPGAQVDVPERPGWKLIRRLGAGGFGEVWLAANRRLGEERVFKFCFDADKLRSLKREIVLFRVLKKSLRHRDDIVPILDLRVDAPPFFLETEFVAGGDLLAWAEERGGLETIPLEERLQVFVKSTRAVAAAHSIGIVHRDIKPSNILVEHEADGTIRPRLADFGIGVIDRSVQDGDANELVRDVTVHQTQFWETLDSSSASASGTQLYSPPEYMVGVTPTFQGDIFSLGVMLYQLAIGSFDRPLAVGWDREIEDDLLRDDIAQCVDGDPSRRLARAEDLADRIERLAERREEQRLQREEAEAAQAREREQEHRAARARRNRKYAAVAACGLVLTVGLVGWGYFRELGLRTEAEELARANELLADSERASREHAETARGQAEELALRNEALAEAEGVARDRAESRLAALFEQRGRVAALAGQTVEAGVFLAAAHAHDPDRPALGFLLEPVHDRLAARTRTLYGHVGRITELRRSADGQWLASASADGTVKLWDAATGRLTRSFDGHTDAVTSLAFASDDRLLISTSVDRTVGVHDLSDGSSRELSGHDMTVNSVDVHPSGLAVTAGTDGTALVWNTETGAVVAELEGHEDALTGACFSPDAEYVATSSLDATLRIWDVASGTPVDEVEHGAPVMAVAFHPDGREVVCAGRDGTVSVWNAETARTRTLDDALDAAVTRVRFVDAGRSLLAAGADGRILLWTTSTWALAGALGDNTSSSGGAAILAMDVSAGADRLLATYADGRVREWDLASSRLIVERMAHGDGAHAGVYLEGDRLATGGGDGLIHVWRGARDMIELRLEAHDEPVEGAVFDPDGQRIVTAGRDGTAIVWRAGDGSILHRLEHSPGTAFVLRAEFDPQGRRVVTAGGQTVKVWDAADGRLLWTLPVEDDPAYVADARFMGDGRTVLVAERRSGRGQKAKPWRVWDVEPGTVVSTAGGAVADVTRVERSADGHMVLAIGRGSGRLSRTVSGDNQRWITSASCAVFAPQGVGSAVGTADGGVITLDYAGSTTRTLAAHEGRVTALAYDRRGARLVSAGVDGATRVWDLRDDVMQFELGHGVDRHDGNVSALAWSPDGAWIVTGDDRGTCRIWEAATGSLLLVVDAHRDSVRSLVFDAASARILTASTDGSAKVLRVPSSAPDELAAAIRDLVRVERATSAGAAGDELLTQAWNVIDVGEVELGRRASIGGDLDEAARRLVDAHDRGDRSPALMFLMGDVAGRRAGLQRAWKAHEEPVGGLAMSRDGSSIVSYSTREHSVRLWDTRNSERRFDWPHESAVWRAVFSPDGRRVVTSGMDPDVRIWDAVGGQLHTTLRGHRMRVAGVAFSPDGRRVVSGSRDATARIWDADSGECLHVLEGHRAYIAVVGFNRDGRLVVTGSDDATSRLWSADDGSLVHELARNADGAPAHTGDIWSTLFHDERGEVLTGGDGGRIVAWDVADGSIARSFAGHTGAVNELQLSADGALLLSASNDGTARLWDYARAHCRYTVSHPGGAMAQVRFLDDDRFFATAGVDRAVRIWEVATGQLVDQLDGHGGKNVRMTTRPGDPAIFTASADGLLREWRMDSTRPLGRGLRPSEMPSAVMMSADGGTYVVQQDDGRLRVHALGTMDPPVLIDSFKGDRRWLRVSADGRVLLASADGAAMHAFVRGDTGWTFLRQVAAPKSISAVAIDGRGERIALGDVEGSVRTVDLESGAERAWSAHERTIRDLVFGGDGRLVSASEDATARVWSTDSDEPMRTFDDHAEGVTVVAVSAGGDHVLTGSWDRSARIRDVEGLAAPLLLYGHPGAITDCSFSPDDTLALTIGGGVAHVWSVVDGTRTTTIGGGAHPVTAACFTPDGDFILVQGAKTRVEVFDAHTGRALATLHETNGEILDFGYSARLAGMLVAVRERGVQLVPMSLDEVDPEALTTVLEELR